MQQRTESIAEIPLVVDLDGTLIRVDSLHEAFVQLLSTKPLRAMRALLTLGKGPAVFKAAVAEHLVPDLATMPLDHAVVEAINRARESGRKVYLATAADRRVAVSVPQSVSKFDGIFASEDGVNLKGKAKADCLVAAFGMYGFDYIGNDVADIPVWQCAHSALVAGAPSNLVRRLDREMPNAVVLSKRSLQLAPYLLALRPHQWLKNGLVLLPIVAGHDFSINGLFLVLIAFMSFSFGASSIYLVNDMLDLPHDRLHQKKRHRALAAGKVPLNHAFGVLFCTAALAIALALLLPWDFVLVLAVYCSFSISYSFYLKRKLMIDVVALAMLYGIRVIAGAAATGIHLSSWLIGFCFFIFLSLALMKRATETITLPTASVDNIKGRGYRRADLPIINSLTTAAGLVGVLVLSLYINSPDVRSLYRRPDFLWGICIILVYWLGRAFFLTGRGEMSQDPVVFAATDRISLLAGALMMAAFLLAL